MPQPVTLKKLKLNGSMKTSKTFRTNTQKRCLFHYRGLEWKSRKSRNTWSNRQIWPWNTEWSRAKANRVTWTKIMQCRKEPLSFSPWQPQTPFSSSSPSPYLSSSSSTLDFLLTYLRIDSLNVRRMSARSRIPWWLQLDLAGEFQGESGVLELSQCFSNPVTNVTCYGLSLERGLVPGASAKNSAHGKGHEVGGSAYAKAGSSLRSPPGNSRASTPKPRVCLLYCFVLSPTPLTLQAAVLHHLSLKKS